MPGLKSEESLTLRHEPDPSAPCSVAPEPGGVVSFQATTMSTRDRPEHADPPTKRWPALSREDADLVADLERRGVGVPGAEFGRALAEDDELMQPGPTCPGGARSILDDRR